jgi:hypothetical protein
MIVGCHVQLDARRYALVPYISQKWKGNTHPNLPMQLGILFNTSEDWRRVVTAINDKIMPIYPGYKSHCFPQPNLISDAVIASCSNSLANYDRQDHNDKRDLVQNSYDLKFVKASSLPVYQNAFPSSSFSHRNIAAEGSQFVPALHFFRTVALSSIAFCNTSQLCQVEHLF